MKGDFSRDTFDPLKHFSRVLTQQGRVSLDADWNEQADITAHRTETEARDVIGLCGAPKHNAGFKILNGSRGDFTIGAGRFYVRTTKRSRLPINPICPEPRRSKTQEVILFISMFGSAI